MGATVCSASVQANVNEAKERQAKQALEVVTAQRDELEAEKGVLMREAEATRRRMADESAEVRVRHITRRPTRP